MTNAHEALMKLCYVNFEIKVTGGSVDSCAALNVSIFLF